jgi:hypothetical protein
MTILTAIVRGSTLKASPGLDARREFGRYVLSSPDAYQQLPLRRVRHEEALPMDGRRQDPPRTLAYATHCFEVARFALPYLLSPSRSTPPRRLACRSPSLRSRARVAQQRRERAEPEENAGRQSESARWLRYPLANTRQSRDGHRVTSGPEANVDANAGHAGPDRTASRKRPEAPPASRVLWRGASPRGSLQGPPHDSSAHDPLGYTLTTNGSEI